MFSYSVDSLLLSMSRVDLPNCLGNPRQHSSLGLDVPVQCMYQPTLHDLFTRTHRLAPAAPSQLTGGDTTLTNNPDIGYSRARFFPFRFLTATTASVLAPEVCTFATASSTTSSAPGSCTQNETRSAHRVAEIAGNLLSHNSRPHLR